MFIAISVAFALAADRHHADQVIVSQQRHTQPGPAGWQIGDRRGHDPMAPAFGVVIIGSQRAALPNDDTCQPGGCGPTRLKRLVLGGRWAATGAGGQPRKRSRTLRVIRETCGSTSRDDGQMMEPAAKTAPPLGIS